MCNIDKACLCLSLSNPSTHPPTHPPSPKCKTVKYCIVKRSKDPGAGKWSLPGGSVELGEEVLLAAAREAREETGKRVCGRVVSWVDRWEGGSCFFFV